MKKILLCLGLASLIGFSISAQVNLLKNGDMEEQGAWKVAQENSLDLISYTFGSTDNTVNGGVGANLEIKHKPLDAANSNLTIYQELDLVGGEEYLWSCAMRDMSNHGDCWWTKYVWIALEPVDGADVDEQGIAQMHEWLAGKSYDFNGLFDTCTAAIVAESKTNIFIPEADGIYYVGINFGNCIDTDTGSYHVIIDEIAMIDQDSVAISGINTQLSDNGNTLSFYPNPATTNVNFTYSLSENCDVELTLINILGSEVATLINDSKLQGIYTESFDCSNLVDGVYYGVLKANNTIITRKFVVSK